MSGFVTWAAAADINDKHLTTGIVDPPAHPLVLAKEVASLDVLSGGRLTLGVGVGYLRPEFTTMGLTLDHGTVTDKLSSPPWRACGTTSIRRAMDR